MNGTVQTLCAHSIAAGHRIVGLSRRCFFLHGHNYRFHMRLTSPDRRADDIGRIIDFKTVRDVLFAWLDTNWAERMLIWNMDPQIDEWRGSIDGLVALPFNPTCELMAKYVVTDVAPTLLDPAQCILVGCTVDETDQCSGSFDLVA